MKSFKFLLLLCFFAVQPTFADMISHVDSLLTMYDEAKGDDRYKLGTQIIDLTQSDALFFGDKPQINASMNIYEQDLMVWFAAERWMTTCSYFTEAISVIVKVEPLAKILENNDILATSLCDHAYCLYKTSDYTASIEYGQQAAKLCRETDNMLQLSRAYLYMALVNYAVRDYDEAAKLVELAIETNNKAGSDSQTHNIYGIACELYCGAGQVDKAIEYGLKAVEAAELINYRPGIANHLTQLSYAYDRAGEYQKGLDAATKAIDIVNSIQPLDRNQLAISLEFKAWNLIDMKRHAEAVEALRQAIDLEQELGNKQAVCYDYRTLYEALEPIDAREALAALKRYTVMKDSIHSEQLKTLMTKANAELHNDELKQENAENELRIRYITWGAVAVVLLFSIIILSLWYAFRQKRKTAEALRSLNEAREAFFTNVTHEFRTPLTVILGLGNELKTNTFDENRLREAGDMIVRQGNRLLSLVNQMLDISRVKSNIGEYPKQNGDIAAYIAMIVETHQEMARQKGVKVTYSADKGGIEAGFVPEYVDKVVGNLLDNAVKYTSKGGKVSLSLNRNEDALRLVVADTGCGIKEEDLPHIFEPFYRSETTEELGSGVGLALVNQIVETIGGTIDVESTVGVGTTFTVDVPLEKFKLAEDAQTIDLTTIQNAATSSDNVAEYADSQDTEKNEMSILIVEDNHDVSRFIGSLLSDKYKLYYATNGQLGLKKARELMPDLIITDLMMPHTDGLTLCRSIRADINTDHIPIIVVTAKASDADRIQGLQAGADTYLTKPFNSDELRISIDNILEQRERLKRLYQYSGQPVSLNDVEPSKDIPSSALSAVAFMDKVDAIIERLLPNNCTAENLATEMYMSLRTLQRKMMAITGTPPKKYIMDVRLNMAIKMMEQYPDRTIEDIATACGFHDASHFAHSYQSAYGVTPRNKGK